MADAPNVFSTLLQTPENLNAQRQAQFRADSEGSDFWSRQGGLAGLDLRNDLLTSGRGLTPQDRKAYQTQEIMGRAQKTLADMVQSGDMDPLDAQERVVSDTMAAFMNLGDYQSAQALLPGLNQIRTYKAELGKLGAETYNQNASGFHQEAEGKATYAKYPHEIGKLDAEALNRKADAALSLEKIDTETADQRLKGAQAGYYDRMPKAGDGTDGSGAPLKSTQAKFEEQVIGGTSSLRRMGQLFDKVMANPGIGSASAGQLAAIADETRGAAALTRKTGDAYVASNNESIEARSAGTIKQAWDQKRGDLNIKVGEFQSLTMDLAYSLARARDPSGRLSDADISNALKIIGAAGDPARMADVMKNLADNTYADLKLQRNRGEWFANSGVNADLDNEYGKFNETVQKWTKPAAGAAPTAAPDKDGWTTVNGLRIRKKPKK